jgi:hypothetical protein
VFCDKEGVIVGLSRDPKARKRQLANRRDFKGAEPGNRLAVTHGGKATPEPRRQAALEAQICDALPVRDADGGAPAHDMVAVRLLAITLVRLESVVRYVTKHGQLTRAGRPLPALAVEDKLIGRAQRLAAELGMTPTSRAKLGLDLAHTEASLAQLMSDATDERHTRPRPDDIEGSASDE